MKIRTLGFFFGAIWYVATAPAATLVSRYQFENNLTDSQGGHNATVSVAPVTYSSVEPKQGSSSAVFASSYASVADHSAQSFTSSFSVAAWVYITGESAEQNAIVGKWGGGTPYRGYNLLYCTSTNPTPANRKKFQFAISSDGGGGSSVSQVFSSGTVALNTWYHVAGVYTSSGTASKMELYINGQLDSVTTGAKSFVKDSTSPLAIGSFFDNSTARRMHGKIDDVRLYSGALTASEVAALASSATLISRYDFENSLQDSVSGHHASVGVGPVTFDSTSAVSGTYSGSFASSYATVPDNGAQSFTSSFSISSWVYLTGESAEQNSIVGKWGGGTPYRGYNLLYCTSTNPTPANRKKLQFAISSDGGGGSSVSQVFSSGTVAMNTWYHVAGVYNSSGTASTMSLYINGQLNATTTGAKSSAHDSTSPLAIGSFFDNSTARRMHGRIDDVRLYEGVLNAQEIALLYQTGAAQLPWDPSQLGDEVWLEWRAEDLPDGPVAIWSDRKVALSGTQTVVSRQPVKQNGEVYFAGGSSSDYNQGKGLIFRRLYDGYWLPEVTHRAVALVFRIDLSGTQSGGTIFSVNGQSGADAARQPAVNYNAANNTISVGFNSPSSQSGVVVPPYVTNNLITFPLTTTASEWHCLVARRVGTNLHASLDGKDVNGVEGETVIPMADWALPPNNQGGYPGDLDGDNGLIGDHAKSRPSFAIDSIFLVQGDMTTETAKKFMGWGMWRKDAQASLPATHPYRNSPPPPSAPRPAFVESTPQQWTDLVNFWDNAALSETPYEGDPINLTGWTEVFRDDFNQHSVTDDIRGQGTWFAPGHKAAAGIGITAVRPTVNMANRALGGEGTPSTYRHNATEGTMTLRMQLHQTGTNTPVWHTGLFASVNSNGYGRTWMYPYAEVRMKIGPSSTGTTKGIWPAFWFKSLNFYTNRTESNVEYDIYEGYGSSGNLSQHHASIHNWPAMRRLPGRLTTHRYRSNIYGLEIQGSSQWHENINLFDGQYHTYATMVTPQWVINYFDGREMHRFPTPIEMKQPLWLLTSLAMKDVSQAAGIYDLTIDYIRVMQNPAYTP